MKQIILNWDEASHQITAKDGTIVGTWPLLPHQFDEPAKDSEAEDTKGELVKALAAGGMSAEDICKLKNNNVI